MKTRVMVEPVPIFVVKKLAPKGKCLDGDTERACRTNSDGASIGDRMCPYGCWEVGTEVYK